MDGEIQILISAVDNISATLNSVQSSLNDMAGKVTTSSDAISEGFTGTTNNLIAVGQTAESVDRIFSTLDNTQLRLQSSSDRVMNAQDNYATAQDKVNQLVAKGEIGTTAYDQAVRNLEKSHNSLEVSENNLARTQDHLIGTYISIGLQTLELINNIPQLINTVEKLSAATGSFDIEQTIELALMNPIAVGLGVAAAAAGVYAISQISAASATDANNVALNAQLDNLNAVTTGANSASAAFGNIFNAKTAPSDVITDPTQKDKATQIVELSKTIAQQRALILDDNYKTMNSTELDGLKTSLSNNQAYLAYIEKVYDDTYGKNVIDALATSLQTQLDATTSWANQEVAQINRVHDAFMSMMDMGKQSQMIPMPTTTGVTFGSASPTILNPGGPQSSVVNNLNGNFYGYNAQDFLNSSSNIMNNRTNMGAF